MRHPTPWLAGLLLAFSLAAGAAQPAPMAVPGTSVTMAPPAGFALATGFAGFSAADSPSSILLAEMPPQAYAQLAPLFADAQAGRSTFATKGIAVERRTTIATAAGTVPVLVGSQAAHGQNFRKWMALFRGDKVVLATVQAPADGGPAEAEVLRSLASVRLGPAASPQQALDALPFKIEAAAPFRVLNTMTGAGVTLTAGAKDVDPEGRQPLIVVASSLSAPASATEPATLARSLLVQTHGLEQASNPRQESVDFAGTRGVVLRGSTPQGRHFVQYLSLWPGQRYIRLVALLPDGDPAVQAAVDTIAASVAWR
ncbi:MAG: hypothetical protein ACN6O3_17085 [Comamonas sp.]